MVGVLVVDDHEQFRGAARELIEATPGFEAVGEAASGEEALRMLQSLDPDLVLLDVRLPGMNGIQTAARITSDHPHPTVFLVSVDEPADLPMGAASCGAATFIRKRELRPRELRRLWAEHGRAGITPTT
jgi:two-component system invasion response regulator UvrY